MAITINDELIAAELLASGRGDDDPRVVAFREELR
jgi:hypothetical protein